MHIRWRLPVLLTACVVLGQVLHSNPLVDAVTGASPSDAYLTYPIGHVLLAPLSLLADWLNGSPARELKGFVVWAVVAFAFARLAQAGNPSGGRARPSTWSRARHETGLAGLGMVALALYVA